jgi:hypothetical protein
MAWENPVTTWGQAGKTVPGAGDFNRIEGNILHLQDTKETPAGAQAKAEAAEAAAKAYADQEVADLAGEGRTTETVKGNADALDAHLADYATQTKLGHVKIGKDLQVNNGEVSVDREFKSAGSYSTALGKNASATGTSSVALGSGASAERNTSTALGSGASATGTASTALGEGASAGSYSTALGRNASATGGSSVALGSGASATGTASTALGSGVSATGTSSIALGEGASAGTVSIALGSSVSAESYSIALGRNASATGGSSVALGRDASATETSSIALGRDASAEKNASIALGRNASAENGNEGVLGGGVDPLLTYKWIVPGNFTVSGTKNFEIPHPKPSKNATHVIRHGVVETDSQGDNLYRYKIESEKENDIQHIDLPDYFIHLNKDVQIFVTPQGHFGNGYGKLNRETEQLEIHCQYEGEYNVLVIGTRNDNHQSVQDWDIKGVEREIGESWTGETYSFSVNEIMEIEEIKEVLV